LIGCVKLVTQEVYLISTRAGGLTNEHVLYLLLMKA